MQLDTDVVVHQPWYRRISMNPWQIVAAVVAAVLLYVVFACPPYRDDSGLLGGTVYYPFRTPPAEPVVFIDGWLLNWELAYVGMTFVTALIVLSRDAAKAQRVAFAALLSVEAAFFIWQLPRFETVLTPQFTWYGLNLLALLGVAAFVVCGRVTAELETTARKGKA